jgi:hypothetical protein
MGIELSLFVIKSTQHVRKYNYFRTFVLTKVKDNLLCTRTRRPYVYVYVYVYLRRYSTVDLITKRLSSNPSGLNM